jgi:hypothetical protein
MRLDGNSCICIHMSMNSMQSFVQPKIWESQIIEYFHYVSKCALDSYVVMDAQALRCPRLEEIQILYTKTV